MIPQPENPPSTEHVLARCKNAKFFSILDLRNSFWQVPLEEGSRRYTAFPFRQQSYQCKVTPFGLKTSCSALIRALAPIAERIKRYATVFVDDIFIFSSTIEHLQHLDSNEYPQRLRHNYQFRKS